MMGTKERSFAPLVNVSLEELVPQDHFIATWNTASISPLYVTSYTLAMPQGTTTPVDPVVFFRLQLIMFFEGIRPSGN